MQPKISIITVVFNGVNLLEKTITSVLNQTYLNIEYIVVDGASTDGTLKIIDKYKTKVTKHISEKDTGLYHAMNKGLKMATGDYVWFMNCGDQINDKDVLSKVFENTNLADIYYSDTLLIDEKGENIALLSEVGHNNSPANLSWRSMERGMVVCHQSFIVKKSITPYFDLSYAISADIDWVIKCLKQSKENRKMSFCLSKFLVGGISSKKQWKAVYERFRLFNNHFGLIRNLYNHLFILARVSKKIVVKKQTKST